MPNYCDNTLTIESDKATIDALEAAYIRGELLATLRPEPDYEGYKDTEIRQRDHGSVMPYWWEWRVSNWGTKWDVGGEGAWIERISDTKISMSFDSAWSPPVAALQSRNDIQYVLHYCETGCDFCGTASGDSDGHTDETYTIKDAPAHLVEHFSLDALREAMDDQ